MQGHGALIAADSKPIDLAELRRSIVALHDFWQIASLPGRKQ